MKKISEYLKNKYGPWGWMGQRAHDGEGINRILPLDFIISCDYGADVVRYFREDDVFSVEKHMGVRKDWSNEDLNESFKGDLGREIFESWSRYNKPINLLCYRSLELLEKDNENLSHKLRIYAAPEKLKKRFDNKILLYQNLPDLSLPRINGIIEKPGKITFKSLCEKFSLPFVVQFPFGSSGHFTFIIREESEYNKLRKNYPASLVIMQKYIDGFSLNVNAVIVSTDKGVNIFCSFPSAQIVGRPECSNFPSAFCGNDFAAAQDLDPVIIEQVEKHIDIIGKWMAEAGFRGVFGMDFMVEEGTVYPVEINPRFQNSTSLHTVLYSREQSFDKALFLLHIAEFLQGEDNKLKEYIDGFSRKSLMSPLKGSQIILHNRMHRAVITGDIIPGLYHLEDNNLRFVKESASLSDCRDQNDILITCGVPKSNTIIESNAPICKIQMLKSVLDPVNKKEFTLEARKIVSAAYDKFKLETEEKVGMAKAESDARAQKS
jgi:predicted ATP-grasp superfamily ATP-dependent carboligase